MGTTTDSLRCTHAFRQSFPLIAGGQSPVVALEPAETGQTSSPRGERIVVAASHDRAKTLVVCTFLLLGAALVFAQTVRYKFVNYDDDQYVYGNPSVSHGLTAEGITWAFTHVHAGYWAPLTWLSLMLDCQFYGLNAGGHHLSNAVLHAATAILLFMVLRQMTGAFWPSALAAAIFAVHPLRVESVAWVTERKDVLSGLFFVLALGAYVIYVQRPFSLAKYSAIMIFLALGLMAKPILVTLPLVLLLLDYWPLGRFANGARLDSTPPDCNAGSVPGNANSLETLFRRSSVFWQLAIEKLPLVLLSVIFCAVTFWTQTVAREANETLPLGERLANALVSYVAYLGQLVYPVGLAIFYPHPGANLPLGKVLVAVVVFMLVSSGVLACRRRCPYLLMGWLWYLVMLAPVIGVVQAGWQAMADRFTYLPQIGLCIAMAWGAADLLRCCSYRGWLGSGAVALVLAVLMGCAWRQTCFWRDSEILWTHALTCTLRNDTAHSKLGMALADSGRHDAAISQYRKALAIKADNAEVHSNLSVALGAQGRLDDAMMHAQEALRVDPRSAGAHFNLALILSCRGRLDEAIVHYQQGLETEPGDARAHCYLGAALAKRERFDESAAQFEQAVRLKPDDVDAQVQLAWLRATCPEVSLRNGAAAIEHARRARQLCSSPRLDVFNTLAAAYAEAGQFPEAVAAARQALELAEQHRAWALANSLRSRIAQYEAGSP